MLDYSAIDRKLSTRLDEIVQHFGLDLHSYRGGFKGCCPFHLGDNPSALHIRESGHWTCFTRHCEKEFVCSSIGFVRACLSLKNNWHRNPQGKAGFGETLRFIEDFLACRLQDVIVTVEETEKRQFGRAWSQQETKSSSLTKQQVRSKLVIPAQYYLKRGYSSQVLDKFDVGLCTTPNKFMFNRIVVPIYDENERYLLACTGRNIFEKCPRCKSHHNPKAVCPEKYSCKYSKWIHSEGCRTSLYLYNYWNAKKHIRENTVAVITEGPGEVWRLEEAGIKNSVSIFGTELSDEQILMLSRAGALSLVVMTNSDNAGIDAAKKIQEKCGRLFRLFFPTIRTNDIGELNVDEVTADVKPFLDKLCISSLN